tara:strand:- start:132 stop:479 length:348 start_codon:yes stop_codon:yes gene_type:complete
MEFFQKKTGQVIALVTIIGTLAGFGYTGATYVNRLENLEAKIGGISEAEDNTADLENRFAAIETSITYVNKSIDELIEKEVKDWSDDISDLKENVAVISTEIKALKEENDNPLLN